MRKTLTQEKREQKRAQQRKGELSREEMRAKKHQQMMAYERKRSPEVMWDQLLDGQEFEDVRFKKVLCK